MRVYIIIIIRTSVTKVQSGSRLCNFATDDASPIAIPIAAMAGEHPGVALPNSIAAVSAVSNTKTQITR